MIHTNRIVTVGEQESIIDRPIVLYRGDREVEIEFTLVGNEFTFSEEGNVIKSVNASHGQLVLNTPSGEHMFSELAECHEGKVVFVVTKEMIDEFIEMGFYSFQIRLYDSAEMKSRVTIPPVMNGFDIRNPIAAEDETNVTDLGVVDYSRVSKDEWEEDLPTFDWQGNYNKTDWQHHDVIYTNKMNKIEDALYSINANIKESDVVMLNTLDNVKKDADKYVKDHMAEVEADVEEFERNLNADVQQFKIDTNAAMTAHKNEVSEELDGFNSQLTHNKKEIYFNLKPSLTSKQKTSGLTNIFIGLDSLSDYNSWVKGFIERAKAELGNGGLGYVGLQNNTINDLGLSWNHNVQTIENLEYGKYPLKFSLDNKGIIVENGDGSRYCNLFFNTYWTYGKVMYLKQPNGGTFDCKWTQDSSSNTTINTNSTSYDLGVYELPGQNTSTRKGWISLSNMIGNVVVFGVFLYNDEGLIYSRIGKGGDKLYNHSLFDETIRDKWIKELKPDLFILNAGTNDSGTLSADEYYTTLNNYTKLFLENDTQFLCVRQNPIHGNTRIDEYEVKLRHFCKENKLSFTSLKDILGSTYQEASQNGYIDDGVHPNQEGNKKITNHFLNLFSIPLIGKIDDNSPKFSNDTPSNVVIPKTILTPKHIAVSYGSSSILYKLGLINGYPTGLLKLTITGNREGSNHQVRKNVYMVIENGTIFNNANFSGLTITTEYEFHTQPNPAVDFNLNVERVDNQVQISISPNTDTANMRFYVEGDVVLSYNTSKGQAVIEN